MPKDNLGNLGKMGGGGGSCADKQNAQDDSLFGQTRTLTEHMRAGSDKHTSNCSDQSERRAEKFPETQEYNLMKYQLTTDALNIALWDVDFTEANSDAPENKPVKYTWSPEFRHMLGFTDENDFPNVRKSWADRIHPEDKERVTNAIEAHLSDRTGKTPYDLELRIQLKNGQYWYFRTFGKALRDSAGNPLRVAGALMDIDEMKQMERALEHAFAQANATLDYLKSILDKSGTMITVIDPTTHELLFASDAIKQLVGAEDDLAGQICYKVLQQGKDQMCEFCPVSQLDKDSELTIVREEHNTFLDRYFQNTSRYIDWPDGRKVLVQHIIDFTDLKRTQMGIEYRDRLLQAVNQAAILLNSNTGSFEETFYQSMKVVGEAVMADRVCIWKNHTQDGKLYCTQVFEWTETAELQHGKDITINIPYSEGIPGWEEVLSSGKCINRLVRDMSPAEQAQLSPQGIVSLLAIPVFVKDTFWGFAGFDSCHSERIFAEGEEAILRSGSHLLVGALLRNEMEEEIALMEKRLRLMLDTSPICCQIWDRNLNTFECNEAAVKLYGFKDKQEYLDRFLTDCSPEYQPCGQRSDEKAAGLVIKAFEEGRCVFDWTHRMPGDGSPIPAEITLVRVEYMNDYIVLGYTRDLREHTKMMNAIEQTLLELREANRVKSEFLSRMSHEMLTPMNAIMGMTQLVNIQGISEETKKEYLLEIDTAARNLLELIRGLLDVSKKEEGAFELVHAEFTFETMCQTVLKNMERDVSEKKQILNCEIDSSVPALLWGDEKRLAQVIDSLLENAVKFTPEGGEILLAARVLNEHSDSIILQVEVTDNGIGIPKEHQGEIFKVFEQVDTSLTRKYTGIGLGLSLSRQIIEMMGGKIWVESELGKGSKFMFTCQLLKSGPAG